MDAALEPLEPAFVYEEVCRSLSVPLHPSVLATLAAAPPGVLDARGAPGGGARVTDADCDALGETVAAAQLAALILGNNAVGDAGAAALVAGGRAASLQSLDLSNNAIGLTGVTALAAALPAGAPALLELVLDGNPLGDAAGAPLAALVEAHGALAALRLARCELGTDALIAIASALAKTSTLRLLDLSEPRTFSRNEETISHLAGALRANASLERLVLRKHRFASDTAVERLADAILDNTALRELDLGCNALGPPSGATLAKALADGAALTVLQLATCRLADSGATALADVLARGACSLRMLDLRSNDIGDAGIAALAAALAAPGCPLEQLLVWGNPGLRAGSAGATAWGDAIASGSVRAATDVRAYDVDGEVHCAREDV